MTAPADWDGEDGLRDGLESLLSESDQRNARVADFFLKAKTVNGPLGVLLRTVAAMYEGFCETEEFGGTTAAEETRMYQILDAAMDATDFLYGMDLSAVCDGD
jgi:hypothetical protein